MYLTSVLITGPVIRSRLIDVIVKLHEFTVTRQTMDTIISACTSTCVQKALADATGILMEPVMDLQVNITYPTAVLQDHVFSFLAFVY